jgi:hypothetical protein
MILGKPFAKPRTIGLYVVFNCASSPERLAIQDPARLNWKPLSKIEQYQVGASEFPKTRVPESS